MRIFLLCIVLIFVDSYVYSSNLNVEVDNHLLHARMVHNERIYTLYTYHIIDMSDNSTDTRAKDYHAIGAKVFFPAFEISVGALSTIGILNILYNPLGYSAQSTHHYQYGAATLNTAQARSNRNGVSVSYYNGLYIHLVNYITNSDIHHILFGTLFDITDILSVEQWHARVYLENTYEDDYWFRNRDYFLGEERYVHALKIHLHPNMWYATCSAIIQHGSLYPLQYAALCAVEVNRPSLFHINAVAGVQSEYYANEAGNILDEWISVRIRYVHYFSDMIYAITSTNVNLYKPEEYYRVINFDISVPKVDFAVEFLHEINIDAEHTNGIITYGTKADFYYDWRDDAEYTMRGRITPHISAEFGIIAFKLQCRFVNGDTDWQELFFSSDFVLMFKEFESTVSLDYDYNIRTKEHISIDMGIGFSYSAYWGSVHTKIALDILDISTFKDVHYEIGARITL